jgi:hypothetical protein
MQYAIMTTGWTRSARLLALVALASACADRGRGADVREAVSAPPASANVNASGSETIANSGRGVDAPVVIVTIDGVRWQEVFEGTDPRLTHSPPVAVDRYLPNLHGLGTTRGAFVGAPGRGQIAATGPNYISLPGYTELLSGRPSRCQTNGCMRTTLPSILDEARAAGAKVAAFASWERLDLAATANPGGFVMSCGRQGDMTIDPWPGNGEYRPDYLTADVALRYFEKEQPDVFFLGLGDPDEHAHHNDYDAYIASIRHADQILGRLIAILDRSGERGRRTHIVVTADHGRSYDFKNHGGAVEAARVWMVASGPRFSARGSIASPRPRHLADIAPTLRLVLGLAPDKSERAGEELTELLAGDPRVPTAL